MAGYTLFEGSIAIFIRGMESLDHILDTAITHAKENGIDADAEYAPARLVDDMLPLTFQVQCCSNTAKSSVFRLSGVDTVGPWEDNEKTMDELKARVAKTLELLRSVKPESVNGREDVEVQLLRGKAPTVYLPAKAYVSSYALPNFFFHLQTAYTILRAKHVPLGKRDYLAAFTKPYF